MNEFKILEKVKRIRKEKPVKRKIFINCLKAFIIGGAICTIAQAILLIYEKYFDKETAVSYTLFSLILLSSVFTCFGLYDRLGQIAGCGTIIPITGFANSMTSSTMEYKSGGLVVGILNNVFKLAGSVIVVSIVSGVVIGMIRYFGGLIFG